MKNIVMFCVLFSVGSIAAMSEKTKKEQWEVDYFERTHVCGVEVVTKTRGVQYPDGIQAYCLSCTQAKTLLSRLANNSQSAQYVSELKMKKWIGKSKYKKEIEREMTPAQALDELNRF